MLYVYGVVPSAASLPAPPSGIDGVRVTLERSGEITALCSSLGSDEYAPARVEARVGDMAWLGPRAVAHDAVLSWAAEHSAVVPFPIFTLFSDHTAVVRMLEERDTELARALARIGDGREYGVRIFRDERLLAEKVAELSPSLAALERQAAEATPGQRYLLERKLEQQRSAEVRRVSADVARECYRALASASAAAVLEPPPRTSESNAASLAIMNGSFLVSRSATETFRARLTELAREHEGRGFRFEFTGPWPPYHFVGDSDGQ
jgi:hypothetical protein